MPFLLNKTFDEIRQGDEVSAKRVLQARDIRAWDAAFGNADPLEASDNVRSVAGIVTAMLTSLCETTLPGPGSSVRSTLVHVCSPLPIDAVLTTRLKVTEKRADEQVVILAGQCTAPSGSLVATAVLEVAAPKTTLRREIPEHRLEGLLERCTGLPPMLTGVVHPCSPEALAGALGAAEAGLIVPVLFGPETQLREIAAAAELDLYGIKIVSSDGPEDSALKAAIAAGSGEVRALMKGSLHTDILLHAIMQKEAKLLTGRLLSHCFMLSVPTYARRVIITDAALNIAPDTDQKRDICQNAIGFALAMGIALPKVAVLAAVELVSTKMQASLDGAILAKMADRRQIVGGLVDGPLDLDAAVDVDAARIKHIDSKVAGAADILMVPNIEAGNMIYKELAFMADGQVAGLVVGARVPVMLTSRADTADARRFSAAAAVLYADALARDPARILPDRME